MEGVAVIRELLLAVGLTVLALEASAQGLTIDPNKASPQEIKEFCEKSADFVADFERRNRKDKTPTKSRGENIRECHQEIARTAKRNEVRQREIRARQADQEEIVRRAQNMCQGRRLGVNKVHVSCPDAVYDWDTRGPFVTFDYLNKKTGHFAQYQNGVFTGGRGYTRDNQPRLDFDPITPPM